MEPTQLNLAGIKDVLNSEAFKQIEDNIIKNAVSEAGNAARRELELFKFEAAYSQIVSEKERLQVEKEIDKIREEKWEKALQKSKGNEEKALLIV